MMFTFSGALRAPLLFALALVLSLSTRALGSPLRYGSSFEVIERRGCGTDIDLDARWEIEDALLRVRSAGFSPDAYLEERAEESKENKTEKTTHPVTLDVYWHIVYANETKEGGYVSDEQINEQMNVLNADYKASNISWSLKNITRIPNEDWFFNAAPGTPQEKEMKKLYHRGDSSALNVFTAQFNSTTKALGFASLPSAYLRDPLSDGLIIRHSTLPGGSQENYNHGRTTVHEAGHWLGLYHTFEGGCEGVGDNVMDTAPEASESVGCPVGRKSCPDSKQEDPIHNFMDCSWDTCMTHFTPGQMKRMHEVIWAFRTKRPPPAASASASVSASATATSSPQSTSAGTLPLTPISSPSASASVTASETSVSAPTSEPDARDEAEESTRDYWDAEEVDFQRAWEEEEQQSQDAEEYEERTWGDEEDVN